MKDIHHINLAAIDLNLLVVFDALMAEQNVSRAGQRLGLSQPATSNALKRLRRLVGDDLFLRTATGLRPTPTAIALGQQLHPALQQIQAALVDPAPFDPATSDRVFGVGMSDYGELTLLPRLIADLQTVAPGVGLQIRSGDRGKLLALLDRGEIDLVCGVFPEVVPEHRTQTLFTEHYTCLCRQDHPTIGDRLSLEDYVAASHLLVSVMEDRTGRVDALLAHQHLQRRVVLSLPHFLAAPFVVAQTDVIATLAHRIALTFAHSQPLKLLPLPLPLPGFTVSMRWHRMTENSAACRWLRSRVLQVSQTLDLPPAIPPA